MKYIVIVTALFFAACSSTKKTEIPATETKQVEKTAEPNTTAQDKKSEQSAKLSKGSKSNEEVDHSTDGTEVTKCIYGEIKREIKVIKSADKCTVEYVKDGNTQEIASGASQSGFCTEIGDRVKNNLANAGYTCE